MSMSKVAAAAKAALEKKRQAQRKKHGPVRVKAATQRVGMRGRKNVPVQVSRDNYSMDDDVKVGNRVYKRAQPGDIQTMEMQRPVPMRMIQQAPMPNPEVIRMRQIAMQQLQQRFQAQKMGELRERDPVKWAEIQAARLMGHRGAEQEDGMIKFDQKAQDDYDTMMDTGDVRSMSPEDREIYEVSQRARLRAVGTKRKRKLGAESDRDRAARKARSHRTIPGQTAVHRLGY